MAIGNTKEIIIPSYGSGRSGIIPFCFLLLMLVFPFLADGQPNRNIEAFGTDLGGTIMSPSGVSDPISSQYHLFVNHGLSESLTGEVSLGLVFLSSDLRKSRLFSVDYRVLYSLQSVFNWDNRPNRLHPYLYSGIGINRFQLLNVGVQDDPLLRESDGEIPNTSIWNNGNGWSLQIPLGLGLDYHLSEGVALRLNAGYHLASRAFVRDNTNFDGYFGATIGMKFTPFGNGSDPDLRPRKSFVGIDNVRYVEPSPLPAQQFRPPAPVLSFDSPEAENVLAYKSVSPILFETLAYQLDEEVDALEEVVEVLKANPDLKLKVAGYADPRGNRVMNRSLSNLRGWGIAKSLIEKEIDGSRIWIEGLGEERVSEDQRSAESLAQSRRTEIVFTDQLPSADLKDYKELPTLEPTAEGDLISASQTTFEVLSDELTDEAKRWLTAVAEFMKSHQDVSIQIMGTSYAEGSGSVSKMVREARAASAAKYLNQRGVALHRMQLGEQSGDRYDTRSLIIRQTATKSTKE